ncbi:BadF/BadG/BcrA/BcrD ATPase family protein [Kribbella sp. NPDC006257]|uniref:N-acetylglucosamine kinase n=1 Tax=Kribbella sp. NPDC006257 TaxID=3156738 RepID=UPI0033A73B93
MTMTSGVQVPGGVLAFDAGNSKTDVALVSADGRVLGTARGGGFEPHVVGAFAAVEALAPLVAAAALEAGLIIGEVPLVQQISACMANADLPIEEERITAAFEQFGWAESVYVTNDTFALLRSGVDEPRGVAVVCGAGINCAGLLPDGRTARFPAVGKISGDWGGGQQLADEAFWAAARADDGRGPATALTTALPAHYGVGSMTALIEAVHLGDIPFVRRLEATPILFQVAAGGDAVAAEVVRHQAEEVVAMAVVAMRRLDLLDEPTDVVLGGGVLTAGHPLLMEQVVRLLSAAAPKAVPHVVDVPPVVGAALLGLDRTKAAPTAHAQLRAAFAPPSAA